MTELSGIELVPLCGVDLQLGSTVIVGEGPSGTRMIVEVPVMTLTGERLNGTATGRTTADWVTLAAGVATIDVRATIETDDGAAIFVQYRGRTDASGGIGTAPIYVAPFFETGDARYAWLNGIVAVGKGSLSDLHYDWYEVR